MLQILLHDLNMNQLFCSYFICYSCLKTRTFHSLNLLLPRIIWLEYRYINNELSCWALISEDDAQIHIYINIYTQHTHTLS